MTAIVLATVIIGIVGVGIWKLRTPNANPTTQDDEENAKVRGGRRRFD